MASMTILSQSWFSSPSHMSSGRTSSISVSGSRRMNLELSCTQKPVELLRCPAAFPTALGIEEIQEILPHRYPFLFVDRVSELVPGVSGVGIKHFTANENFMVGHFPRRPVMPGVLIIEAMAQVGAVVLLHPEAGGVRDTLLFAGVEEVKFKRAVVVGDTLVMRMHITALRKRRSGVLGMAKSYGEAYVGDQLVCKGQFAVALSFNSPGQNTIIKQDSM